MRRRGSFASEMWGKVDSDTSLGTTWVVRVYWYDSSGAYIKKSNMAAGGPGDITTTWATEGGLVTAPSNAVSADLTLQFYNGSGWVAYDDAVLKPVGGSNLSLNPGFESSGGWTSGSPSSIGSNTTITRNTWGFAEPQSGSYAYSMTTDAYGNIRSDQFPVTAGQGYDVSVWIRGEVDTDDSRDTGTVWIVRVRWEDLNGGYLGYSNAEVGTAANGLPASFTEKGGTVTAPAGAVYGRAEVYFYLASGWLNVDDVSVTPTTTVNISETKYYGFGGDTVGMRVDGVVSWIFSDQHGSTGVTYLADGTSTSRQF